MVSPKENKTHRRQSPSPRIYLVKEFAAVCDCFIATLFVGFSPWGEEGGSIFNVRSKCKVS